MESTVLGSKDKDIKELKTSKESMMALSFLTCVTEWIEMLFTVEEQT